MELFEGTTSEGSTISVLYEDDNKPCLLRVVVMFGGEPIEKEYDVFPNALVLSAFLRSAVNYTEAYKFLESNKIPHSSDLWDLNHDHPFR